MAQTNVPFCSDAYDTNFAVVCFSISPRTDATASAAGPSALSGPPAVRHVLIYSELCEVESASNARPSQCSAA